MNQIIGTVIEIGSFLSPEAQSIVLFNLSAVKKQKEIVLSIVSEKKNSADWHVELSSAIQNFLCDTGLTHAKVAMQYKYVDDEFNEEYLSKGLAVLYNFFTINCGRCSVTNEKALKNFLVNTDTCTPSYICD